MNSSLTADPATHARVAPPASTLTVPAWWTAYVSARYCLEQRETSDAEDLLREVSTAWPQRAEPLALLAHLCHSQKRWREAYDLARQALALPRPTDGSDQFEPDAWDSLPLETLALASWHVGDHTTGRDAADRLMHDRRVAPTQRARALYISGWYLDRAPFAWSRRLRVPRSVLANDESPSTPAIVRDVQSDGYLLMTRLINYDLYPEGASTHRSPQVRSNTALARLDADAQPLDWLRVDDTHLRERTPGYVPALAQLPKLTYEGLEDVRPVWWRDAWWFTATCWHFPPTNRASVVLGRLTLAADGATARVEHVVPLTYAARQPSEKNWLPFVDRATGDLLLLYHAEPLTILRPDVDSGVCTLVHQQAAALCLEGYRGSTGPIPWRDGYLYLAHTSNRRPGHIIYHHRLIELDAVFSVRRMTQAFHLRGVGTEYSTGICVSHDGAHLVLSHSWMDAEPWLSAFTCAQVNDLLQPLDHFMLPTPAEAAAPHDLPDWWRPYRRILNEAFHGGSARAIASLEALAQAQPGRAEPHYHLARLTRQAEQSAEAYGHAAVAAALTVEPPTDGTTALEPDAWLAGPLHELAISGWHAGAYEYGRTAADLLRHDHRVSTLQRSRAVGHLSWYLELLPLSDTQPLSAPAGLLAAHEVLCNGSLALLPGGEGYLLAQRVVNYALSADRGNAIRAGDDGDQTRSRTLLARLDHGGQPGDWLPLDDHLLATLTSVDPDSRHGLGIEDLRLIAWQDAWWFTACTSQLSDGLHNDMLLGRIALDADGTARVDHLVQLHLDGREVIEKNWLPFVTDAGDLRLLYGMEPLTTLRVDIRTGICERETVIAQPVALDHYRNSAGPIHWGAGYLLAVHEVAWFINDTVYQHRFVELDADFNITRITLPFALRARGIEYILGLCPTLDGDGLLLHHSWNDQEAWLSTLSFSSLDSLLLPVEDLLPEE